MACQDPALGQALGAGRAGVVAVDVVEQAGAQHAPDRDGRADRDDERGQDQVVQGVADDVEPAVQQPVDGQQPGRARSVGSATPMRPLAGTQPSFL